MKKSILLALSLYLTIFSFAQEIKKIELGDKTIEVKTIYDIESGKDLSLKKLLYEGEEFSIFTSNNIKNEENYKSRSQFSKLKNGSYEVIAATSGDINKKLFKRNPNFTFINSTSFFAIYAKAGLNKTAFFKQEFDLNTLQPKGELEPLFKFFVPTTRRWVVSSDSSKIAFVADSANSLTGRVRTHMYVYDNQMNLLWKKVAVIPNMGLGFTKHITRTILTNKGEILLTFDSFYRKKDENNYKVIHFDSSVLDFKQYEFLIPNYFKKSIKATLNKDESKLVVAGMMQHDSNKSYLIYHTKIDLSTKQMEPINTVQLSEQFVEEYSSPRKEYKKHNDKPKFFERVINSIKIRDDGSLILISEEQYSVSGDSFKKPYYYYGNIRVFCIKGNQLEWAHKIYRSYEESQKSKEFSSIDYYRWKQPQYQFIERTIDKTMYFFFVDDFTNQNANDYMDETDKFEDKIHPLLVVAIGFDGNYIGKSEVFNEEEKKHFGHVFQQEVDQPSNKITLFGQRFYNKGLAYGYDYGINKIAEITIR